MGMGWTVVYGLMRWAMALVAMIAIYKWVATGDEGWWKWATLALVTQAGTTVEQVLCEQRSRARVGEEA